MMSVNCLDRYYGDSCEIEEDFCCFISTDHFCFICMGSQLSEDISDE